MSDALRLVVAGANGKMGRAVIEAVQADKALALAASFDIGEDAAGAIAAGDVLIDFTRPEGTLEHLAQCRKLGKAMVIGTTGFSDSQRRSVADAARRLPIVLSPNFAVGVNVVFKLAETAARILGDGYDVEIVEAHHRHKVDAPSGTAFKLGEIVASALKRDLKKEARHGREGDTGARPPRQIGFHAIRGGDIVGEHTVIFAGTGERVEVAVRSQSRATYAAGALRAAKWLRGRPAGLYDMGDVLGLK
ncbi:MAG: 4-hydroxy-tetrahydrodipicolinate reductase [Pseudomonadota bacterium]